MQRVKKHFNTTHTNSNERVDNRDLLINSLQQQIKDLKAELSQEGEYSEKPSTHKSTNNDSKNIVILKDQIDPTVLKKVQKKTKKMHWWNKIFRN